MKKLIFLLIMALAFVSLVPAMGTADPPGVFTLSAALLENSGYEAVVTSSTVLATQGIFALPVSLSASQYMINGLIWEPCGYNIIKPIGVAEGKALAISYQPDYYLRL